MAVLKVEKREGTGKYVAFNLRKQGMVPAVIYGRNMANSNVYVNEKSLQAVIATGERLVDLELDGGKKQMAVLKAVQHENIGDGLVHADFRAVDENTALHVEIEIELRGEAKGLDMGGIVEQDLHKVAIECLPKYLPEAVVLDISGLGLGKVYYVKDLPVIEGVKYTSSPEVAVVSCHKGGAANAGVE